MNYNSPLGNKRMASQPFKEIDVPDESGYSQESNEKYMQGNFTEQLPRNVRRQPMPNSQAPDLNAAMAFRNQLNQGYEDPGQVEEEFKVAREAKQGKQRISEGARHRIEMLVGMTRTMREVVLGENTFVLQSLKSKETRESLLVASTFDGTIQVSWEVRKQYLARSLIKVAGIDINQFVGSDLLEARLEFIDNLDEALLERLYNEYLLLTKDAKEKYAIKTEKDAEEVAEDLKK